MARQDKYDLGFPSPVLSEVSPHRVLEIVRIDGQRGQMVLARLGIPEMGLAKHQTSEEAGTQKRVPIDPMYLHDVAMLARSAQSYSLWSQHRETYQVHPAMSRSLFRMKSSAKVPMTVLQRLRHHNPLFVISGAVPISHGEGLTGRVLALQVSGAVTAAFPYRPGYKGPEVAPGDTVPCDTHDPDANAYAVNVFSEVHSPDGTRVEALDKCRLIIPIQGEYSVEELVARLSGKAFVWTGGKHRQVTEETRSSYLETAAKVVVSHLLYATSRTAELDEKARSDKPPVKRQSGQPKPEKAAKVRNLGYRTGAVIEDFRRRPKRSGSPGVPNGRIMPAHIRSPHLHMYLVGPGRRETEFKWLDPIPVNTHLDDGETVTNHRMGYGRNHAP